uniref:Uncharacterized protein n=1 Tax=Anguilla anguilla TaxID=7936 RepID=A0A0E9TNS1_ANGAN
MFVGWTRMENLYVSPLQRHQRHTKQFPPPMSVDQ